MKYVAIPKSWGALVGNMCAVQHLRLYTSLRNNCRAK